MNIRPSIPAVEGVKDEQVVRILAPIKAILDSIGGVTATKKQIKKLGADATLGGVITKVNEILDRLQT